MSILPPEVHAALTQLLQGLSSPDNDARTFAEDQLNTAWVATQPDVLLMGLVEVLGVAQEPNVSNAACLQRCHCVGISRADPADMPWVLKSQGRLPRSSSVAWPRKIENSPEAKTPRNSFHRYSSRKNLRSDRNCWNVFKEKNCRWSDIRSEMRLLKLQDNIPTRVWKTLDY